MRIGKGLHERIPAELTATGDPLGSEGPVAFEGFPCAAQNGIGGPDVVIGNALSNHSDVDRAGNPPDDILSVIALTGNGTLFAGLANAGESVSGLRVFGGFYGSLQISWDESFGYTVDNDLSQFRELRAGDSKAETFTYPVSDGNGGGSLSSW